MLKTLPRNFDQLSTVQIQFKRHIDHRSIYMHEPIRLSKTIDALDWLMKTPLYKKHKIHVNQKYIDDHKTHNEDIDLIVDLEYMKSTPDEIDYSQTELIDDPKDPLFVREKRVISQDDTGINNNSDTNEEVLIINRNQEMVDNVLIIAPGQNKKPISSQRFENFQELCFPRTYGGHAIDENRILSYSKRMKYETRNVDRRSCETTLLLLMVKLKIEMSVVSSIN
ncbi:hypothetical protein QAD02_017600 [Eretmocerus hayati]|uniref:Uncharacterized protein n=1 Tax=Eretmocerus hayati TaxID=131215 RepID=A0ACC2PFG9_9HYME|nr:hypothetical protein QAD02_017600 [Eretmocerus hayati]